MKVLYLIDSLKAYGAEKSLVHTAILFKKITPVFVHLDCNKDLKEVLTSNGINVYSLNGSTQTPISYFLEQLKLIYEEENPEIIHSVLFRADVVGREFKKTQPNFILVGSLVSNSYSKYRYRLLSPLSRLKHFITQLKDRSRIAQVDYFISNSNAIVKPNMKALGISSRKIKVIHRGRDHKDFKATIPNDLAQRFKNKTVFLTVGRLVRSKGQIDLIKAFKEISKIEPNYILLIAGDGPHYDELAKKINELDLRDQVYLLGFRNDIRELLGFSDYFLFASYYEGLSGALIEAILMRKPCIVSGIPENKECFPEGNGIFFEPGNISDIKSKIQESLSKNLEKEIEANFKYAISKFSIHRTAEEYEKFYQSLLEI